jgi:hypothetical protein
MGNIFGTKTSAVVDNIINQTANLYSETLNKATSTGGCANLISRKGCTITGGGVNQNCRIEVDFDALSEASSSTDINQKLDTTVKNSVDVIAQNFSLTKNDTENITRSVTNLVMSVKSSITNTCQSTLQLINSDSCENSIFINVKDEQSASGSLKSKCVLKSENVIKARQELISLIDSHTKVEIQDAISKILMLVALILFILFAGPALLGSSVISTFMPLIMVVGVVFLFRDCVSKKPWICKESIRMYIIGAVILIVLFTLIKLKLTEKNK